MTLDVPAEVPNFLRRPIARHEVEDLHQTEVRTSYGVRFSESTSVPMTSLPEHHQKEWWNPKIPLPRIKWA